jgi:hypothetical protein
VRAFIVRPFGTKEGTDFDRVERELISPALKRLEITGRTTGEIAEQGNIRTDMFQRLATADLVVADISIHNANVFYELGLRHALRERMTFLLRSRVPFPLPSLIPMSSNHTRDFKSCTAGTPIPQYKLP